MPHYLETIRKGINKNLYTEVSYLLEDNGLLSGQFIDAYAIVKRKPDYSKYHRISWEKEGYFSLFFISSMIQSK